MTNSAQVQPNLVVSLPSQQDGYSIVTDAEQEHKPQLDRQLTAHVRPQDNNSMAGSAKGGVNAQSVIDGVGGENTLI